MIDLRQDVASGPVLTRRKFGKRLATMATLPSVLPGCGGSAVAAYDGAINDTWRGSAGSPADLATIYRELIRYATLAANSHNTQPWKFKIEKRQISILPDYERRNPVVDPDDHHLFVSLGCATENLVLAARALGMSEEVTNDSLSGVVRIGLTPARPDSSPLFEAIPHRESTRANYDGKVPSTPELTLLEAAGAGNGVNALLLTDRRQVESIVEYVTSANTAQMANRDFLAELKRWIRFNESEALWARDGLFSRCSGNPSLPHWLGSFLFDVAFSAGSENDKYARQMRSSAGVAVFVSEISDKMHWVAAGRRCQHFALQATALGMRIAFVNQPVEVSAVRSQLAAHLGIGDRRPDLIVRFGYGPEMPRSLRRPVEEVIA